MRYQSMENVEGPSNTRFKPDEIEAIERFLAYAKTF